MAKAARHFDVRPDPNDPRLRRPPASSFVISSASFDDFMPRNQLLEMGLEGRPFTTIARYDKNHRVLDPILLTVTPKGVLHSFVADEKAASGWRHESHDFPELKDAMILRMEGIELEPSDGGEHLLVAIIAERQDKKGVVLVVEKSASGWSNKFLPTVSEFGSRHLQRAALPGEGLNFARINVPGTDSLIILSGTMGGNLVSYAFDKSGNSHAAVATQIRNTLHRMIALRSGSLAFAVCTNSSIGLVAAGTKRPEGPRWEVTISGRLGSTKLPFQPRSAGLIVPVNDAELRCHGLIVMHGGTETGFVPLGEKGEPGKYCAFRFGDKFDPKRVVETATSIDDHNRINIFARDVHAQLWHCIWDPRHSPDVLDWNPTGHFANALSAPAQAAGHVRLFATGLDGGVDQIVVGASGESWLRSSISVGTPKVVAQKAIVHAVQVSTVTAQSVPVSDTPVVIGTDYPVMLEHEGRLLRVAPGRPLTLKSNSAGMLRFKMLAQGLNAPELTLKYTDSRAPEMRVRPQDSALRRLGGHDPRFPVTAQHLRGAGLLPDEREMDQQQAQKLTSAVIAVADRAHRLGAEQPAQFQKRRTLQHDPISGTMNLSVTISRRGNHLSVHQELPSANIVDVSAGWSWTDLVAWIGQKWHEIKDIVLKIRDGVVYFGAYFGGVLREIAAKTAHQICEGIQTVLSWVSKLGSTIIEAGKRLIGWLAEKLGWGDVIRAKDVIKGHTLQVLRDMEDLVGTTLPDLVNQGIERARSEVENAFERLAGFVEGEPGRRSDAVNQLPARAQVQANGATMMSVQHAVSNATVDRISISVSPALEASIRRLCNDISPVQNSPAINKAIKDLAKLFEGRESVGDALKLVLGDVIRIVKQIVLLALDAIDVIQRALFDLAAAAIDAVRASLEMPISKLGGAFAWIDSQYRSISGGASLTVIDLATLMFAAPGVILYHLMTGKDMIAVGTKPPEMVTYVAVLKRRLELQASSGEENSITSLIAKAQDFFKFVQPIFARLGALWTFIRTAVSPFEDAVRLSSVTTGNLTPDLVSPFSYLSPIADWGLRIFAIANWFFPYVAKLTSQFLTSIGRIIAAVIVLVLALLVCALVIISLIFAWRKLNSIFPAEIVWALAAVSVIIGAVMFSFNLAHWLSASDEDRAKPLFHVARVADTVSYVRSMVQLALPMGGLMIESGEPDTMAAGWLLVAANFSANVSGYGLSGLLYLASMP